MNPITVVWNAVANRVGPIGARRYCQRNARSAYVVIVTHTPSSEQPRVGLARFFPHLAQVDAAEEVRQQPNREKQDDGRAKSGPHVLSATVGIRIRMAGRRPVRTLLRKLPPSLWENAS